MALAEVSFNGSVVPCSKHGEFDLCLSNQATKEPTNQQTTEANRNYVAATLVLKFHPREDTAPQPQVFDGSTSVEL